MKAVSKFEPAILLMQNHIDQVDVEYQAALETIRTFVVSHDVRSRCFAGLAVERAKEMSGYTLALAALIKAAGREAIDNV